MLNGRQLNIVSDLENAKDLITANYLANKYRVSLRTIRNDIEEIAYSIQHYDVEFIRVPKMGMRIISNRNLKSKLMYDNSVTSFVSLSSIQQNYLLACLFYYVKNPVTLDFIANCCLVSKGTISAKLKACEKYISGFGTSLFAVKHKGTFLAGSNSEINSLFIDLCDNISYTVFNSTILNSFFDMDEIALIGEITSFIANDLLFYPTNHDAMTMVIGYIIKNVGLYQETDEEEMPYDTESIVINPNLSKLILFLNERLGFELGSGYISLLRSALLKYTDATSLLRNSYDASESLERAVHLMVQEGVKYYPELLDDIHDLEKNLLMHLYYTLNRIKANLDNKNPLIDQIRDRFGDIFDTVKKISRVFSENYPLDLNDDECSYITLYFINFIEKARHNKPVKAILVCNSGIGATKLLYTKIRNNFPSIEIVNTSSYFDIQSKTADLNDVSLIISTINIPDSVQIPSVIVSPLLDLEDAVKISKYLPNGNVSANERDMNLINSEASYDRFEHNEGYLYAEVSVALYEMLSEIYVDGVAADEFPLIAGITTHIFMSINRWITHDYIIAPEFEKLRSSYPREMKSILRFLAKVEKILRIYIDPVESVAILRYMIASPL
ncbi:MAG: PRD domain-containing protein [Erysipelotrichaceae bacterium]|nr:PRD domain-containing protein [Erysipelotrichaceae bacterium]